MIKSFKAVLFCALLLTLNACNNKSTLQYKEVEGTVQQNIHDVVFGDDTAPNSIFLYANYNCQYCRYLFSRTLPDLKENYLDKGLVKVVVKFVDFGEDPQVLHALKAASCIYRFGKYQKFHELLLARPSIVRSEDFKILLDDIMAKNSEIAACLLGGAEDSFIQSNVKEFRAHKFSGTPTMVMNNHAYGGFISYENLEKIIKKEFEI